MWRRETWPKPNFVAEDRPHVLFILAPPYTGSTAIATLLNSSTRTMLLHEQGEGQWLIPGLCAEDRWNPKMSVDDASVEAVWIRRYQDEKTSNPNVEVVIEKSPPNMMRIDTLAALFPRSSFLAYNRDPVATCASHFHHHHAAKRDRDERLAAIDSVVQKWIDRSTRIRELVEARHIPMISYEAFCKEPALLRGMLQLTDDVIASINFCAKVSVKGSVPKPIENQNGQRVSDLTVDELALLHRRLAGSRPLLQFFGYDVPASGEA